jgi:hypothetical protein
MLSSLVLLSAVGTASSLGKLFILCKNSCEFCMTDLFNVLHVAFNLLQPPLRDSESLLLEEVLQVLAPPNLLPKTPTLTALFSRENWITPNHVEVDILSKRIFFLINLRHRVIFTLFKYGVICLYL